ncbi:MAG: hypothetical protein ACP5NP_08040 [Acetobacteraceae bacterium]
MEDFTSEDDLNTFAGWMKCQGFGDTARMAPGALAKWRGIYEESLARKLATPKMGPMKLKTPIAGDYRYAVAVREGSDLWLTLWVRRSPKGEFFVMRPRPEQGWDPHTSYHRDGSLHMKNYAQRARSPEKRQRLGGAFRGTEHLGAYFGHTPREIGAVCDPGAFSAVVEVPSGVLGPRDGAVIVDLVEPGGDPVHLPWARVVRQEVFSDTIPWIVIRISASAIGFPPMVPRD